MSLHFDALWQGFGRAGRGRASSGGSRRPEQTRGGILVRGARVTFPLHREPEARFRRLGVRLWSQPRRAKPAPPSAARANRVAAGARSFALSVVKGWAKMSNLETYREKALKCVYAADEVRGSSERAELFGLASVYMALADYVDHRHEHDSTHHADQDRGRQKDS
jgi:hypothetical protein